MKQFYLSGNNDGDYIRLVQYKSQEEESTIYLEVGHCCVVMARHQIPIEYLTKLVADSCYKFNGFEEAVKGTLEGFPKEYVDERTSKVKLWD